MRNIGITDIYIYSLQNRDFFIEGTRNSEILCAREDINCAVHWEIENNTVLRRQIDLVRKVWTLLYAGRERQNTKDFLTPDLPIDMRHELS